MAPRIDRRNTVAWGLWLWWDATQAEAITCQSTQELIPRGHVRLLWESSEEDDKKKHAAIFEVKFGKKEEEGVISDSHERTADTLFNDLASVALAIEGSDLNTTEDHFRAHGKMHYSRHHRETTGNQIRSSDDCGVVCHLKPRTGNEVTFPCSTVLQNSTSANATHTSSRCHCWRCQCGSTQILQKALVPRFVQFFGCCYVERDATWGQHGTPMWKQTS